MLVFKIISVSLESKKSIEKYTKMGIGNIDILNRFVLILWILGRLLGAGWPQVGTQDRQTIDTKCQVDEHLTKT